MADIASIVQEQSYKGDASLGGGTSGVISIDTKPVEELARYTMFYNKAEYDQRQKDIDAKVDELAKFTALDLNGTRAKDKDYLLQKWDEVQKASADYARYVPKDQNDKVRKLLEYQKQVSLLKNDINSGNKRAIAYGARLNAINSSSDDAATKDAKLKKLNEEFDKTDITTPIAAEDAYSIAVPKIGDPVYSTNAVSQKDANGVLTSTFKLFDPSANLKQSFAEAQGLMIEPLPPNATQRQKDEYEAKLLAYKKGGATLYQDAATAFNNALNDPKYKNADGTVNYDQIKSDNPLLASTVKLVDDWNSYAETRKRQMESGAFYDRTGSKPLASLYSPNDYFTIDKNKPLTAQQLIFLQKFKDAVPDGKQEKYDYTGEAIARQNANTNAFKAAIDNDEFKLKERQWNESQKGGETVKNGAMEFAKNSIYNPLTKLADQNGVISPDAVRKLNNEQLKYLGVAKPSEQGGLVLNPLDVPKGSAIVLRGNEIRVLTDAKKQPDGTYQGMYDPNFSTTLTNVATNRLNEQLKNAGSKELNSYLPIDLQNGSTVSVNNTQTTTESSGSAASSSVPAYTREQLKGAKWTDEQISQAVSAGKIKLK